MEFLRHTYDVTNIHIKAPLTTILCYAQISIPVQNLLRVGVTLSHLLWIQLPYIYFLLDETVAGSVTNVPYRDIHPQIIMPLNTLTLKRVLPLLKIVLKHNCVNWLLVLAGCVMSMHYSAVIRLNSGCPMIISTGDGETEKSTAIKTAIFLTGASV